MSDQSLMRKFGGYLEAKKIVNDHLASTNTHVSDDGRFWTNEWKHLNQNIRSQLHRLNRIRDLRVEVLKFEMEMVGGKW